MRIPPASHHPIPRRHLIVIQLFRRSAATDSQPASPCSDDTGRLWWFVQDVAVISVDSCVRSGAGHSHLEEWVLTLFFSGENLIAKEPQVPQHFCAIGSWDLFLVLLLGECPMICCYSTILAGHTGWPGSNSGIITGRWVGSEFVSQIISGAINLTPFRYFSH